MGSDPRFSAGVGRLVSDWLHTTSMLQRSRSLHPTVDGQKPVHAEPGQDTNYLDRTRQQLAKVSAIELILPSTIVRFPTTASDLGFIVDSQLNMSDHVAQVCARVTFNCFHLKVESPIFHDFYCFDTQNSGRVKVRGKFWCHWKAHTHFHNSCPLKTFLYRKRFSH